MQEPGAGPPRGRCWRCPAPQTTPFPAHQSSSTSAALAAPLSLRGRCPAKSQPVTNSDLGTR